MVPHPESGTRKLYYLTRKGKGLVETLTHLVRWSSVHLPDQVYIPEEKLKILRDHPDLMIQQTLDKLQKWEEKFGI